MTEEHIDLVSDPETVPDGNQYENEPLSELEQLRIDLDEAKNRSLRALADLENFRARTNRQAAEERKYANIDLLRELLPVWDNIGRTLEAVDKTQHLESLIEGVRLVHQQFLDVLIRFHCEKIEAKYQMFDPNFHASVAQIPNEEHPANTVIEEIQTGFRLFERVVRPSQVVLSAGKPSSTENSNSTPQTE
ncbi:MAG: nucleotide exchange factor GrpE [Planctomycetaceae bacterium]|jgi:molecular chaperone GrpE|nr:nucleotide exchange factor GrpE [Planctomycetaceae bacterium]